jgi:hypothetical protein
VKALPVGGHFAGYVWIGHLSSMAATWRVPTLSGSELGRASSWVGAEAPGPGLKGPFIQVGTQEEKRAGTSSGSRPYDFYAAFWSDTARDFRPYKLLNVSPGDVVTASLSLSHGRWTVRIRDETSGASNGLITPQEGTSHFNEGEFLQEDVAKALTAPSVFSYPHLSKVTFSDLVVNGAPPRFSAMESAWMAENGALLAPGPLTHDAFSLGITHVTAAGERYLRIVDPFDAVVNQLNADVPRWTAKTPASVIRAEVRRVVSATERGDASLTHATWPPAAEPLIRLLVRQESTIAQRLSALRRFSVSGILALSRPKPRGNPAETIKRIRAALHLPSAP